MQNSGERFDEGESGAEKPRENIWQRTLSKIRFRGDKNRGETAKISETPRALQSATEEASKREEVEAPKKEAWEAWAEERGVKIAEEVVEKSGSEEIREPFVREYVELQRGIHDAPKRGEGVEMDAVYENISKQLSTALSKEAVFVNYARRFGMDEEKMELFRDRVYPAIERRDPEARPLWGMMAAWAGDEGDWYGVTEFMVETMVTKATPANLAKLGMIEKTVPASAEKHAKNRGDSLDIEGILILNHDFIHNEVPGAHEYVHMMVEYHDAAEAYRAAKREGRESEELKARKEEAKEKLRTLHHDLSEKYEYYGKGEKRFAEYMGFDFDEDLERPLGNFSVATHRNEEAAIEVLRRLDKNTEPSELTRPATGDAELDKAILEAEGSFEAAGRLISLVNERLSGQLGKAELEVLDIQLMNYTDRVATLVMRKISKKDWAELMDDPGFKEMCRFLEITSQTGEYRSKEFEEFWERTRKVNIDEPEVIREAYRKVAERRLSQISGFSRSESKFVRENVGMIWSGNLNNEILRLHEGPAAERGKSEKSR